MPAAPFFSPLPIEVLDTTLREGSYVVDFQLDEEFVTTLLGELDATPVEKIEIGHGIGFEAELAGLPPCNISPRRWCALAGAELTASSWGMFAQPEFSRLETLEDLCRRGMSFVRIGLAADQVRAHLGYLKAAAEICGEVYLNLMKSSATPPERIPALLDGIPDDLAGLYVVDSYGSMLPRDVGAYVTAVRQCNPVAGFHGHDNLGLANANSLAALEAGANLVDGTLAGLGRGAGNAETESLAGILSRSGSDQYAYRDLARLSQFCRSGLTGPPENRNLQVLGGVIGIHSGFFPLIEQLCAEHGLDPAEVMETATRLAPHAVGKSDLRAAAELLAQTVENPLLATVSGGAR